jgi:predicted HTH domain antitoxin
MPVMSLRLEEKDLEKIRSLASEDNKDQSTVARELISYGWNYLMVRRYAEGKLSLEGLARELGKSVSETTDLLAEMGVPSPINYDDYLEGYSTMKGRRTTRRSSRSRK